MPGSTLEEIDPPDRPPAFVPAASIFISTSLFLGGVCARISATPFELALPVVVGFLAIANLLYVNAVDLTFNPGAKRKLMAHAIVRTLWTTGSFALMTAVLAAAATLVPTHSRRAVVGVLALSVWWLMMAEAAGTRGLYGKPYPAAFAVGIVARLGGGWLTWQGVVYFVPKAAEALARYV